MTNVLRKLFLLVIIRHPVDGDVFKPYISRPLKDVDLRLGNALEAAIGEKDVTSLYAIVKAIDMYHITAFPACDILKPDIVEIRVVLSLVHIPIFEFDAQDGKVASAYLHIPYKHILHFPTSVGV